MTNSDAYLRWLECECDACKALAELAHDKPAWDAKLEESKRLCPNWAPEIYDDCASEQLSSRASSPPTVARW